MQSHVSIKIRNVQEMPGGITRHWVTKMDHLILSDNSTIVGISVPSKSGYPPYRGGECYFMG
jgi:hypothetical protein